MRWGRWWLGLIGVSLVMCVVMIGPALLVRGLLS